MRMIQREIAEQQTSKPGEAGKAEPILDRAAVEKDRARFSHAPLIVTVIARLAPGHKVPEQEQLLTAHLLGTHLMLIDGGVFDWVARLASNQRAVFVASGLGSQLVPVMFRRRQVPG